MGRLEDLRDVDTGDEIAFELESGEEFEAVIVGFDGYVDETDGGYVAFPIEGDLWEQVNDRVDSEVLRMRQTFGRGAEPEDIELFGSVVTENGNPYEDTLLGIVESIQFTN